MLAVMEDFSGLEKLFAVCAVIGGVLFAVRLVLQFVGGDVDVDDVPDGDIDFDGDAGDAGDSDISFKVMSFQGFMSFFMIPIGQLSGLFHAFFQAAAGNFVAMY